VILFIIGIFVGTAIGFTLCEIFPHMCSEYRQKEDAIIMDNKHIDMKG
jgi:hypothetical protein